MVVPFTSKSARTADVVAGSGLDRFWPPASSSIYDRLYVSPFDVFGGHTKLWLGCAKGHAPASNADVSVALGTPNTVAAPGRVAKSPVADCDIAAFRSIEDLSGPSVELHAAAKASAAINTTFPGNPLKTTSLKYKSTDDTKNELS